MFNKQKVISMMKQNFLSIIAMCVFCLIVLPVQADDSPDKIFKAYPNPVSRGALLTVEIPVDRGEMTVFLYNTVGKVVQTFKTSNKKVEFNAPNISGIYFLRFVEQQKVVAVEKIIVKE